MRFLLFSTLTVLLSVPLGAQELPRRTDDWFRMESAHFTILSNSSRENAERIVSNLERLHDVFEQLKTQGPLLDPLPTTIYLFRSDLEFTPYKPLDAQGRPGRVAGYFLRQPFGNYVAINGDPRQDPSETIYHEFVHHFTATNLPGIPVWFNEGLAEFYSTFRVARNVAEIGRPKEDHVRFLQSHALLPFDQFLEVDAQSDLYRGGDGREDRRGVFYAQSWATAHYLLTREGDEARAQLADFFARLESDEDAQHAFVEAFGRSLMDFEGELTSYVDRGRFPYFELPVGKREGNTTLDATPLSKAEVFYYLGDLLTTLNPPRLSAARRHFDAALKEDFGNGLAQAGLGRVAWLEGDREEAIERYRIAVAKAPDDAMVQYLYGAALAEAVRDRSIHYPDATFSSDPDLSGARRALESSLALRPDFAPALAMLGMTYLFDDQPQRQGLDILRRARRLAPERPDVLHNLALLNARLARFDDARRYIDQYLARLPESSAAVRSARAGVAQLELRQVALLINQGQLVEATRLAGTILPGLRDPELEDLLAPEVERLQTTIRRQEAVDLYNRAVVEANGGQLERARSTLLLLLEQYDDPEVSATARDALRELSQHH